MGTDKELFSIGDILLKNPCKSVTIRVPMISDGDEDAALGDENVSTTEFELITSPKFIGGIHYYEK